MDHDKHQELNIFISFGGSRGNRLAQVLQKYLKALIGPKQIFVSSDSIYGGEFWAERIQGALNSHNCCLIILDSIGVRSPWVYYEAGAAALLNNRTIIPILFDVVPDQVEKLPFSSRQQIQVMEENQFVKDKFLRIFMSIYAYANENGYSVKCRSEDDLKDTFELIWGTNEKSLKEAFEPETHDSQTGLEIDYPLPSGYHSTLTPADLNTEKLDDLSKAMKDISEVVQDRLNRIETSFNAKFDKLHDSSNSITELNSTLKELPNQLNKIEAKLRLVLEKSATDRGSLIALYDRDIKPMFNEWLDSALNALEAEASTKERQYQLDNQEREFAVKHSVGEGVEIDHRMAAQSLTRLYELIEANEGAFNAGSIKEIQLQIHKIYRVIRDASADRSEVESVFRERLKWAVAMDTSGY